MSTDPANLPPRPLALGAAAHKGDAGRVVVLAGSREMPGAALLAVGGALRGGAGLVTLGCLDAQLMGLLPTVRPEALLWDLSAGGGLARREVELLSAGLAERAADVVLCGPGIGRGQRGRRLVAAVLSSWHGPLVLDADALTLCAEEPQLLRSLADHAGGVVLTPHPGEAARLLGGLELEGEAAQLARTYAEGGQLGTDPVVRAGAARLLARELRAVVCLKGAGTVVARPGGSGATCDETWINPSGNPGLATGGTGDVLAGCLAALLVPAAAHDGDELTDALVFAARQAVYLHGLAGDRAAARVGRRALLAGDLLDELGPAEQEGPWAG